MPSGRRRLPPPEDVDGIKVEHRLVPADGIDLHVATAGDGRPVVLLHGFPEHWRSWQRQLAALVHAGFAVWVPDLRGYNLSDRPRPVAAYRMPHLLADVSAVVRATGHARAHLVGHDWGGVIAWTLAGYLPHLVDRLAILNAPHLGQYARRLWHPRQFLKAWYLLLFQLPWLPERLLSARDFAAIRRMFARTPARPAVFSTSTVDEYVQALSTPRALTAALNYYRANFRSTGVRGASTARIAAETLVVWGERDPALDPALLDGLADFVPRLRIVRLADVGHWVQHEVADDVNRMLVSFLRGGASAL